MSLPQFIRKRARQTTDFPLERPGVEPIGPADTETIADDLDPPVGDSPPVPGAPPPLTPQPPERDVLPPATPELPQPPRMGRISRAWRRRLTDFAWPRPGYAADSGRLGEFEVIAASVIGQSHLHDGAPRQDSYHFLAVGDAAVLAIADGVSARPLAGIGAETAAYVAVSTYAALLKNPEARRSWDLLISALMEAIAAADGSVRGVAAELQADPEELSTTLLVADLRRDITGNLVANIAGVGNSSALMVGPDNFLEVIAGPSEGGSPSEYHQFIPGSQGRVRATRAILPPGAALLLVTDGLADDLHASAKLRSWVSTRLSASLTPIEFAHVLSYRRQGSSDDLTAIAAAPSGK
jgi:serine/threonine protein phosphatase PrpC